MELRLTALFDRFLAELKKACLSFYGDRLVSLAVFGSVGRGTPRPDSDVDVLVVAEGLPNGRLRRVDEFRSVEQSLACGGAEAPVHAGQFVLSPVIRAPEEIRQGSPLLLDLVDDARILYDRDNFLAGELARLRERLKALGARRVWRGDAWWWDLKPDYRPGDVFEI